MASSDSRKPKPTGNGAAGLHVQTPAKDHSSRPGIEPNQPGVEVSTINATHALDEAGTHSSYSYTPTDHQLSATVHDLALPQSGESAAPSPYTDTKTAIRDDDGRFRKGHNAPGPGRGNKKTVAAMLQMAPESKNKRIANRLLRDAGAGVASAQRMVLEYQDGLPVKRLQVIDEGGPLASLLSSLGEVIDAEVRELPDGESAHN